MCGIIGACFKKTPNLDFSANFDRSLSLIGHRGPDMQGTYKHNNVHLGHTRLSILDLSDAAIQPMISKDENLVISYNGEVYNYKTIQEELSLQDMQTTSDTEVLLKGFEKIGVELFKKLNGMFAFSIYCRRTNKLWLVRDHIGIKPLYYSITSDTLSFASEIKSLLALNNNESLCNISSLNEWLFYGNNLGTKTSFEGISKLSPGNYLEINLSTFQYTIVEYWSVRKTSSAPKVKSPIKETVSKVRSLLHQSIERQLVSDVPVGVFLSGGIDSSAITAIASKYYNGKLATYSAGFDYDKGENELPKARKLAKRYGTEHHEIHISGFEIPDIVEKMVEAHDSPFSDAANIPLYLMSSEISSKTKVVLQGDGGDELFGGYKRYSTLSYYQFLNPMAKVANYLNKLTPSTAHHYRRTRYFNALGADDLAQTFAFLLTEEDGKSHPSAVFSSKLRSEVEKYDPFRRYKECQQLFSGDNIIDQMAYVDSMIILPDIFLEKVDRSTMASSIEVRVPFLDMELVEYCLKIPGSIKNPFGKKKHLLKLALAGTVPDDVLYGKKIGFSVPYGYWLRTSLKPLFFDHLEQFNKTHPNIINNTFILRLYKEHESRSQDRSFLLWKTLNFMMWVNKYNIQFRF